MCTTDGGKKSRNKAKNKNGRHSMNGSTTITRSGQQSICSPRKTHRAASTLELMRAGVERIYQGVFLQAGESGIPDLLERVDGHSKLGKYFYRPVDIKAGSGYENADKGTLRDDYGMQLYHYALLLESVQGTFPPDGDIPSHCRRQSSL
jgi:predicted RecB family nuclease